MTSANHAGRRYVSRISKFYPQHTVLIHLQHVFTFIRSHVTSEYGNGNVQHTAKSEVFTTGYMVNTNVSAVLARSIFGVQEEGTVSVSKIEATRSTGTSRRLFIS